MKNKVTFLGLFIAFLLVPARSGAQASGVRGGVAGGASAAPVAGVGMEPSRDAGGRGTAPWSSLAEGPACGRVVRRGSRGGWSVYGGGGLSRASGVGYPNLNAGRSLDFSPSGAVGVDFTLRPRARFGAEYLWARWRREQRPEAPDPSAMPFKAYGSRLTDGHSVKLHADFNLMGFRKGGKTLGLDIWAGTGVGFMSGVGNEYSLFFSTTRTCGGATVPVAGEVSVSDGGSTTITGNVRSVNDGVRFSRVFIPATLHFEAGLSRRWTAGVKCEADFPAGRGKDAPEQVFSALFTLRYHFVRCRAQSPSRH